MVEDNLFFRDMIREFVSTIPELLWIGGCGSLGKAKVELGGEIKPSILLLDINLPDGSGIELLDDPDIDFQKTKIVFVSGIHRERALLYCVQRQVAGYIDKTETHPSEWMVALKFIAKGQGYFSPQIDQRLRELRFESNHWSRLLSRREIQFLPDIGSGATNAEMAKDLGISDQTVQWHRKNIMRKLSVQSATALLIWCRSVGFAE